MRASHTDFTPPRITDESPAASAIDVMSIIGIIRRGWRFPVIGALIGLVLGTAYLFAAPTPYKSSARILVDRSVNRYLQTNRIVDQPTFDQPELESQVHILQSESILIPVIRSMGLAQDKEFVGTRALGETALGRAKKTFLSLLGFPVSGTDDNAIDPNTAAERVAVDALLKGLSVYREDVANVITITFASQNPNKAAAVANTIADMYIASTLEAKTKSTKAASQWLQDRLIELKVQAIEADRALQNYRVANNLVNTEKGLLNSEQLTGLKTQLTQAKMAMAEAKARFDRIQNTISEGSPNATVTDALNNSVIVRLRSQYLDLASKAAELQSRVGAGHIAVVKLHERMGEVHASIRAEEQRIAGSYASEYEIAKARESELAAAVNVLVDEAGTNSQAQVTMRELENSAETIRNLYKNFLQKYTEIDTIQTQAIAVQDARIVTRAAPPLYKSSKKALALFSGSIVFGLFLGAAAAVAREWVADVFRTPNQVEEATGITCQILPIVQNNQQRGTPFAGEPKSTPLEEFVLDAPYSRFTESLRNIKTLITTAHLLHGVKVIGVVSSVPKEGKTTIGANLAALMIASSGCRTLLIDGDLHKRSLTARLAPDAKEGLIECLADPSRLAALVSKRQRSGLDVLPCVLSARVPNAAELLGSPEMEQLLAEARKTYDYVLVEIAPVMSVVDVKTIERLIDRFVFVVEWGQTKRSLVLEAFSEAGIIRERVIGIVLNKADPVALKSIEAYKGNKFGDYYEEV